MKLELMFSSKMDDWSTPQAFFNELDKEFNFTLDPCADKNNAKCLKYYTKTQDGLKQNWGGAKRCFAILHMVEILKIGSKKQRMRAKSRTLKLLC